MQRKILRCKNLQRICNEKIFVANTIHGMQRKISGDSSAKSKKDLPNKYCSTGLSTYVNLYFRFSQITQDLDIH